MVKEQIVANRGAKKEIRPNIGSVEDYVGFRGTPPVMENQWKRKLSLRQRGKSKTRVYGANTVVASGHLHEHPYILTSH